MDYAATLRYLYSQLPMYQRIGAAAYKTDLTNTIELLKAQGNPEQHFRSIHVAGTNGKGSVSHLLASVLQCAGYKTGLYTSPHLKDFRERIRVNGEMIPKEKVTDHVSRYRSLFEKIQPSFFEMTVGMAFEHFSHENVDIAVIETGLGGRLDSTNVIVPVASVITNIGYDHMQFLGNDRSSIAREKAGIIKAGVPVVIGNADSEIRPVFETRASELGSPIHFTMEETGITIQEPAGGNESLVTFDLRYHEEAWLERITCPLGGSYQEENFRTVYCVLGTLADVLPVSFPAIIQGYREVKELTGLRGRWEVLSRNPFVVADIAHNKEGLKIALGQWMKVPANDRHIVLGMVDDKDISGMLKIFPKEAHYYFCKPDVPRGLQASLLRESACDAGLNGEEYQSVMDALEAARSHVSSSGSIYIGGSTFVVAEVL